MEPAAPSAKCDRSRKPKAQIGGKLELDAVSLLEPTSRSTRRNPAWRRKTDTSPQDGPRLILHEFDVVRPQEQFRRPVGDVAGRMVERFLIKPYFALRTGSTLDSPMKEKTKGEFGVS
jgi:hypothetical protein